MTSLPTKPCQYCGRQIVWTRGTRADGSLGAMPMDPRPPVYKINTMIPGDLTAEHAQDCMVLHHATCTKYHQVKAAESAGDELSDLREKVKHLADENATLREQLRRR